MKKLSTFINLIKTNRGAIPIALYNNLVRMGLTKRINDKSS